MARPFLYFFLMLVSVNANAQKIRYVCHGCTLSVDDKRKIQAVVGYENDFFVEVFGSKKLPHIQMSICGDRKSFKRKDPPMNSAGFYSPARRTIAVLKTTDFLNTCYHESVHALFHAYTKVRPVWINEGLATYYEYAKVDSLGQVRIFARAEKKNKMRSIVAQNDFSIGGILEYSHWRFHKWREHRNYCLSWGIVYYLMTKHKSTFQLILYRISSGIPSKKAINDHYTGGVAQLEKDLVEYYK